MPMILPWFPPFALSLGWLGTRSAMHIYRERGPRNLDAALMLLLAWFPLLIWICAQFTDPASRLP